MKRAVSKLMKVKKTGSCGEPVYEIVRCWIRGTKKIYILRSHDTRTVLYWSHLVACISQTKHIQSNTSLKADWLGGTVRPVQ